MRKSIWSIFALLLIFLLASFASASTDSSKTELEAKYSKAYVKLPLSFIENKGQMNKAVRYVVNGPTASAFFTNTGVTFDLADPSALKSRSDVMQASYKTEKLVKHTALRMDFAGASSECRVTGVGKLPGKVNVLQGMNSSEWKTDISTYKGIMYKNAWKGIDVAYAGNRKQVKYDIIVYPGAKVSDIKLRYSGADKIWLDTKGDLHIKTAVSSFTETVPGIFQTKAGKQIELKGGYVLLDEQTVGFRVQGADPSLPIVIDPASDLVYSTFIGGSGSELVTGIAVDSEGCAYITGYTNSSNYPVTSGAFDSTYDGTAPDYYLDAFVTKINAEGTALEYSTFIGSPNADYSFDIAVDASGYAYITGVTSSSDFPTTTGAFDTSYNGGSPDFYLDSFVTKLNQTGTALEYSTFLGGSASDYANSIDVDGDGCAYVGGYTGSADYPTTAGAYDVSGNGDVDAYVTKLNVSGSALVYSTFIGGLNRDSIEELAIDGNGCAYVTGTTSSSDYPTIAGAFDTSYNGGGGPILEGDVFASKLNASGSSIDYSTFIGGSNYESASGLAVDGNGCAYITGYTLSSDFPVISGAYNEFYTQGEDIFAVKLNSTGSTLEYSTYIGGTQDDRVQSLCVDSRGCAYLTGYTMSQDFPTTANAYDNTYNGNPYDAFLVRLDQSGSQLAYSTYIGGSNSDYGFGIAIDDGDCVYVSGLTYSSNFPVTDGAYNITGDIFGNAYIAKFALSTSIKPDIYAKASSAASYTGMNVYENIAVNQVCSQTVDIGQTASYRIRIENDGNISDVYTLKGDAGSSGWIVSYRDVRNVDHTSAVVAGTFETPTLASGESYLLFAYVKPASGITAGTSEIKLSAVSTADSTIKDSMEFDTTCTWSKPDIYGKVSYADAYTGMNIYETTPSYQVCYQPADILQTVTYRIRIENKVSNPGIFKILGEAGVSGWKISYRDVNNIDYTSEIIAGTFETPELDQGESYLLFVYVTPQPGISASYLPTKITASAKNAPSVVDSMGIITYCTWAKPDIYGKSSTDSIYAGMNVYSPTSQSCSQSVDAGQTAQYRIRIENDGAVSDTFTLSGSKSGSGWKVSYRDVRNRDLTAEILAGTYQTPTLASGESYLVFVYAVPEAGASGSAVASLSAAATNATTITDSMTFTTDLK